MKEMDSQSKLSLEAAGLPVPENEDSELRVPPQRISERAKALR